MKSTALLTSQPAPNDQSTSLQEQTYLLLRRMIKDGRIHPGERLLETQVVKAFGISRSPARRALEMLLEKKLIQEDGRRGYRIAGPVRSGVHGRLAALIPVKITQPRQWEIMYSEVEQELLARLLFGSVRINDLRLAQHYGVSRTVTRDLLARMHGVGLIGKDNTGHWVAPRVAPERIRHLYEMRQLLEPQALISAAQFVPEPVMIRARNNILSALANPPIDSSQFDQTETDLHVEILSFSPNKEILQALRRTDLLFAPTRHLLDPILGIPMKMIEDALREHLDIVDLLRRKKLKPAASALRTHLEVAVDRWLARFEITARMSQVALPPYLTSVDEVEA